MTELETKAIEAWTAMRRAPATVPGFSAQLDPTEAPMPAGIALDMVQDVCGDRDDAVQALLDAAAEELIVFVPQQDPFGSADDAQAVASDLRGEHFAHAASALVAIEQRVVGVKLDRILNRPSVSDAEYEAALSWGRWCDRAKLAIELGRAISAAAYPTE